MFLPGDVQRSRGGGADAGGRGGRVRGGGVVARGGACRCRRRPSRRRLSRLLLAQHICLLRRLHRNGVTLPFYYNVGQVSYKFIIAPDSCNMITK